MTEQAEGVTAENVADSRTEQPNQEANSQEVNWKAANETMAQQKQRLAELERQNEMLLRQQQEQMLKAQQQSQPSAQDDPWGGLDESDVLTVGEFKGAFSKAIETERQQYQRQLAEQQQALKLMQMRSQYSDYDTVVANTLKKAETNPALAQAISSSQDPHLLAYELGKVNAAQEAQKQADTEKLIANSQKPGSAAAATAGGGNVGGSSWVNQMSDAEFAAKIDAIKRGL